MRRPRGVRCRSERVVEDVKFAFKLNFVNQHFGTICELLLLGRVRDGLGQGAIVGCGVCSCYDLIVLDHFFFLIEEMSLSTA